MRIKTVLGQTIIVLLWLAIVLPPFVFGWSYYDLPLADRAYSDLHDLFKPTGLIGHGLGIVGTLFIIVGVTTYSMRKRMRSLQGWGKLRSWLTFHIFLCTSGPMLVLWHTSLKVSGIVAISFWSMVIVVTSGILGRYVYVRIPKTAEGHFRNIDELRSEQYALAGRIKELLRLDDQQWQQTGLSVAAQPVRSTWKALMEVLQYDMSFWNRRRSWKQWASHEDVSSEQVQEARSIWRTYSWRARQISLLQPLQRIFTYWHLFHIPLAAVMFIILAVHVVVAILFGYTWIF
jgi:hypothetical protein